MRSGAPDWRSIVPAPRGKLAAERMPPIFKLSLRDLFWLVLVAAVFCAWWVDRSHLKSQMHDLSDSVRRLEETAAKRRLWDGVWLPPPGSAALFTSYQKVRFDVTYVK